MIESPSFLNLLRSLPGTTEEEVQYMLRHFKTVTVPNKEHTVREGEICKQIGYVNKGCFSYYNLLDNGKKSIIQFSFEDWWTGDLDSFLNRKPSTNFWQALEDSELICINRNDFEHLYETCAPFNKLFNSKTQKAYLRSMDNAAKDKSQSAEERYLRMLQQYPQIIRRVPHYDVAAYLGITPESLSRIRNKISHPG